MYRIVLVSIKYHFLLRKVYGFQLQRQDRPIDFWLRPGIKNYRAQMVYNFGACCERLLHGLNSTSTPAALELVDTVLNRSCIYSLVYE